MTKQIRPVLASAWFLSMAAGLLACMAPPAESQDDESTLPTVETGPASLALPSKGTSSGESPTALNASANAISPCRQDGDVCLESAALCRFRGGIVLPLDCNPGTGICCGL
jgi:hypothetical protein